MKQGRKDLMELAAEVTRQTEAKRDYLAPTAQLTLAEDGQTLRVGEQPAQLTRLAETQLAQYLAIPQEYYDRTRQEHPELLSRTVNTWMGGKSEVRLVRTLDGRARAMLSNSYRRVDNYDVLEAVMPVFAERKGELKPVSMEVTETRLYVKMVSEKLVITPKVGDAIRLGFVLSNSEVGLGAITLKAFTERLVCLNGMVRESVLRAAHLGKRTDVTEAVELEGMTSDRTRLLEDAALMSKLRDGLSYVLSDAHAAKREQEVLAASQLELPPQLAPQVIEVVGKRLGLNGEERQGALGGLIKGGLLDAWGLSNAVTALGEGAESYDRATELEAAGGRVLDLGRGEWANVVQEAEKLAKAQA